MKAQQQQNFLSWPDCSKACDSRPWLFLASSSNLIPVDGHLVIVHIETKTLYQEATYINFPTK